MSKDIKKALEHCIEWNCADCPNREELGSGETVCRGRLLPEVLEYVADLEAKLAEYEKFMKDNEWDSVEEMQETLNKCEKKYFDIQKQLAESENQCRECKYLNKKIELNIKNKLMAENCELQKQLAEKDKELSEYVKIVDDLHKQLSDKCDFCDKTKDQDKISFAVEQLEKVKENIHYLLSFDYNLLSKVNEQFDNQIKQLKEME